MAKKLPREDQLRIADELKNEAPQLPAAQVDAAWNDEIVRRVEALERGEVELVDAREVFARIRAKHAR